MMSLLLYLSMLIIGSIIGKKIMSKEKEYKWISNTQVVVIIVLVFTMGMRIGADDRVLKSLKEIGLSAFIITILVMTGSVLAILILRKIINLDKKGAINE
ncbi:LysO family transporter [Anaerovorax odorimutans]|uniref:LysO family transporter n=1 Tax=Anaerovorax odorimutans TaxID=109327 RepID=UPI0003F9322A|nr:LysO family transporter [Anaerovorax odorimutans]